MSKTICVVYCDERSGDVGVVMPRGQDPTFYATVAALVLRDCLESGATRGMVEAAMAEMPPAEPPTTVPEPIVLG